MGDVTRFRKKPVVIRAWLVPDNAEEAEQLVHEVINRPDIMYVVLDESGEEGTYGGIDIETLEGRMRAKPADRLIEGVAGEFYPCKPDIFEATYDPAD